MKIVIFAGGSGRRLWPISRQKSPKQFEPILG
ncbi:MAG: sugar phosphate nucleotidyltransferase, partial [Anaerolineae bacterium]